IGMPFVLIVAAVAARNDGFCGIELGFDRPRGRAVACREFGHRGIGLDREARVHVGLRAGSADFPTTQTLPYAIYSTRLNVSGCMAPAVGAVAQPDAP